MSLIEQDESLMDWIFQQHQSCACETDQGLSETLQALSLLLGDGHGWLPPFVLLDLLSVLELRVRYRLDRPPSSSPLEAQARTLYENVFLGPLLRHPRRSELCSLMQVGQTGYRQRAWLIGRLLHRLFSDQERQTLMIPEINVAQLRALLLKLLHRMEEEDLPMGQAVPELSEAFWESWIVLLNRLALQIDWAQAFPASELFMLERWSQLSTESARIAYDELHVGLKRIGQLPVQQLTVYQEPQEIESRYVDDGLYPTGGLNGLSNRGAIESLLRSELVYMNDDTESSAGTIDLFNLKFLEHELLYYVRDDAQMMRKRRHITLLLDLGLRFSFKDPLLEQRFGISALAVCVALIRHLQSVFAADVLQVELCFVPASCDQHFEQELDLLSIVLGDELIRGELQLELWSTERGPISKGHFLAGHKPYLIWLGSESSADALVDPSEMVVVRQDFCAQMIEFSGSEKHNEDSLRHISWTLLRDILSTAFGG